MPPSSLKMLLFVKALILTCSSELTFEVITGSWKDFTLERYFHY